MDNSPINTNPTGKLMVIEQGANEFILIGTGCHITFEPTGGNAGKAWQYGQVEEGTCEKGHFKLLRIQNGDEQIGVARAPVKHPRC